jgi:tRNA threonylcarbamoyladenosine biosynthesis protein TsaB
MLLAIDTATRGISLALHDGSRVIAEASWETANHHTVELAPAVDAMLAQAKLKTNDLSAVAVALGPGSFTGLRIGLAMAKGLATSLNIPMLGIPTLEILAASQPCFDGDLIAVLQAGRGRICAQRFSFQRGAWVAQDEPAILPWETLIEGIADGQSVLVSGEINVMGTQHLASAVESGKRIVTAPVAERLRRAGYLADRAWARLRANDVDDPFTLVPIYLHQPGVPHP